MQIEVAHSSGYVRIAVSDRSGLDDAREVARQIMTAVQQGQRRLMVSFRRSDPIFRVNDYLIDPLTRLAGIPGLKIALVADTPELFAGFEYISVVAAQKGVAEKPFRSDRDAVSWLLA